MTTLITGASGFIGGWIARLLDQQGESFRVLARPHSRLGHLQGAEYQLVPGDLLEPPSLRRALEGVTQLYHAAGWISFRRRDAARMQRINLEGTVNLLQAALDVGVEKVVFTASIFALGPAPDPAHPATEDSAADITRLARRIPYVGAKLEVEQAVERFLDTGLELVRLYPGLCLGPGDLNRSSSGSIDAWLRGRLPALIHGGGVALMDIRDGAAAHIAAMQRGLPGRRYLATGHNLTPQELFNKLSALAGRRPPISLPPALGIPLADLAETLNILPAIDGGQARLMAHHWWYDSRRAVEELGLSFRPIDETLRDTLAWMQGDSPAGYQAAR